jgi:hypothetical protein
MAATLRQPVDADARLDAWTGRLLRAPATIALLVVAGSELATDRLAAVQVFWWIPREPILLGAALWLVLARVLPWTRLRPRQRRATDLSLVVAVAALGLATLRDWRPFGPADAGDGVSIVHWNAGAPDESEADRALVALLALEADVVLVTDPGRLWHGGRGERFAEAGYRLASGGRFGLASRLPLAEARPVLASRQRVVSRFVVESAAGPLAIDGVDLPSATSLPRSTLTRALAADLAALGHAPADILLGDFNISRGSASLGHLAPDATDAFRAAGSGWGGSYPRAMPLWPIDLALVRAPWRALSSRYVDLGVGRHRAQRVVIAR